MGAKAYNGKWWGAGKVYDTKREADLADPTYYAGKYYLNGQAYTSLADYNAAAAAQSADIPVPDYSSHDSGGFFGGFLGDVAGAFGDVAKAGVDLASDALKPAEKVGKWATENPLEAAALAAGAYYGLPALAGEGAGAGALTGYDAAMADLAASAPAFTGAEAVAGAGALSGYDAAMADLAASTPAFTGAEAATAALPDYIPDDATFPQDYVPPSPTPETPYIPDDATFPPDYVPPTVEPSALEKLTQLAADNPLTTAGIATLAAPTVLSVLGVGQQQPEAAAPAATKPATYNLNPYEFQRTYHDPNDTLGKQYVAGQNTGERNWMTDVLTPKESFVKTEEKASGGKISSHEGLMNLQNTAQDLASQGRYGDDMLVHMNRDEVQGLEALAQQKGTHLTRNPQTGMPEAFSLGDLNPVRIVQGKGAVGEALGPVAPLIAGAALGPAGFGLMSAGAAGLTVGGITALASGNLQKGLMAGLGAYGGASLSAGLSGMGSSAIGDAAKAETLLGGGSEAMAADNAAFAAEKAGLVDKLGAGASYAAQNPTAALKALGEGSAWKGAGILGAAAAPVLAGQMVQTATPLPQSSGLIRPYQFNRKVVTPTDMVQPSYQQGQSTRERNWFEDTLTPNTPFEAPGPRYKKMAEGGEISTFDPVVRMAEGGLPSLGGYASGGNPRLLKGPGDGMSDNIPAVIGGKQPARLADGEFVVPADVVSHLGNGSTEAGAKQLYKMMDRIRAARTGKKKQAPAVKTGKYLPA